MAATPMDEAMAAGKARDKARLCVKGERVMANDCGDWKPGVVAKNGRDKDGLFTDVRLDGGMMLRCARAHVRPRRDEERPYQSVIIAGQSLTCSCRPSTASARPEDHERGCVAGAALRRATGSMSAKPSPPGPPMSDEERRANAALQRMMGRA